MSRKILIAEDDPHIRMGLVEALSTEGYSVIECRDGVEALSQIRNAQPDLVLLDIMMPRKSGFDVCRELRAAKNTVPILMLTAKGQETDKVVGLELGADDYVTKPFSLRELLARVHALLRRACQDSGQGSRPDRIWFGKVEIDCLALRGRHDGKPFDLTPRELAVLALLDRERGHAVSRDTLLNEVWGMEYFGTTRSLDQVIVKIRQKIEDEPSTPRHLLTVHGYGYRLES